MALDITVDDVIEKVRIASDHQGSTQRVLDADLYILITDAYHRYVSQASGVGWPYWVTYVTGSLTAGRGTLGGYDTAFGLLEPAALGTGTPDATFRLELRLGDGQWRDLEPIPFQQANSLQGEWAPTETGLPRYFFLIGTTRIGLLPPSDQAYTYRYWYIQQHEPFTSGSDTLNVGVAGGEWWVVWDVVATLKARDHYPDEQQAALANREKAWQELMARTHMRNKGLPFRIQDTKSQRARRARGWTL